jgi:hypothetical protein
MDWILGIQCYTVNWLVVFSPSWKIWVRQWEGLFHPIYEMEIIIQPCLKPPSSKSHIFGTRTSKCPGPTVANLYACHPFVGLTWTNKKKTSKHQVINNIIILFAIHFDILSSSWNHHGFPSPRIAEPPVSRVISYSGWERESHGHQ